MLYLLAKLAKTLIAPANLLSLLLLIGGFASVSPHERWRTIGRRLCFLLGILLFFIGMLPVGAWMLAPLENRFPPERPDRVDGIVLVGGDENPYMTENRKQASVRASARRYITFAGLAREYPKARLVYIGGDPSLTTPTKLTNADVARPLLKAVGVPLERVTFEDKSQNTYENARLGAALVKPKADENWLLITSAYHMPRAMQTFRKAGWHVYSAPTDYVTPKNVSFVVGFDVERNLGEMTTALYEYAGLLAYRVLGRIDKVWGK